MIVPITIAAACGSRMARRNSGFADSFTAR
jgi:hypothetical protein